MNILLIQNEPYALHRLEQYVRQYYPSDSIASFTDPSAAMDYIERQSPPVDLCFTPVKTNEYAMDAWSLRANDYLLEPVTPEGVQHTLTSCAPCHAPPVKGGCQ